MPHDGTEGLVILGKTNTLEFGVLTRTEPCPFSPAAAWDSRTFPSFGAIALSWITKTSRRRT